MTLHSDDADCLARFTQHLSAGGFSRPVIAAHLDQIEQFLDYLRHQGLAPEAVTTADLARYVQAIEKRFRRRWARPPRQPNSWRQLQTAGVHRFLTLMQGRWPPPPVIPGDDGTIAGVLSNFERSLRTDSALAASTIAVHVSDARRFLSWLPRPDRRAALAAITVATVDQYVRERLTKVQRSSARGHCHRLRRLLTFLHSAGLIARDLGPTVLAPIRYHGEGIPSALAPEHVVALLDAARRDRTPTGRRDYAILMLLSTYGLRAGEVRGLTLDDLDWRAERLWIRHTKTGHTTCVPLRTDVGHALLDYLQHSRPPTTAREVFIRRRAPYQPLVSTGGLNALIRRRLAALGLRPLGRHGPHALRHARALSLQRSGVPLKTIGDLLGHRAASATAEYVKLAEPELRAIALPVPGVSP